MMKFMRGITKKRIMIGGLSAILALVVLLSGIAISDKVVPDSSLQIGVGEKVITIGHIAYAAGTADYTCNGVADDAQFKLAIDALPATGGKISVLTGNYVFTTNVTRAIPNVTIEGNGLSTNFTYDGVNPIFVAGGNRWAFRNFVTDAGGINLGATTGWVEENVLIGGTYYAYRSATGQAVFNDATVASLTDSGLTNGRIPIAGVGGLLGDSANLTWSSTTLVSTTANFTTLNAPTGRGATYVVAASDAPAHVKAQADFVCGDGTYATDDLYIQAAIDAVNIAGGGLVQLSNGIFTLAVSTTDWGAASGKITVQGMGSGTILRTSHAVGINLITYGTLRDLRLDGQSTKGIRPYIGGNNVIIENIEIIDSTQPLSTAGATNYYKVLNVYIKPAANSRAISTTGGSYGIYENLHIDGSGTTTDGLIYETTNGIIGTQYIGGVIENCANGVALYLGTNLKNIIVNGMTIINTKNGIYNLSDYGVTSNNHLRNIGVNNGIDTGTADYAVVSGNTLYNINSGGINIAGNYCTVIGNTVDTAVAGIVVESTGYCTIIGNTVTNCTQNGILMYGTVVTNTKYNTIVGNVVCASGGYGIRETGLYCDYDLIEGNIVYNNVTANITHTGTNTIVKNNQGYIDPGEVRTASGTLIAGNANRVSFAWHDPEVQDILIKKVVIEITTSGGTIGSHLDVGIADFGTTGTHTGANNAAVLTDSTKSFTTNALIGYTLYNLTDGSSTVITANTATTITGVLGGGAENDWDTNDVYYIIVNGGTEFFNDLLLNNVGIYDSWVAAGGGTQTVWVFCDDSASATNGWIVGQILDANAALLVGKWYVEYVGR